MERALDRFFNFDPNDETCQAASTLRINKVPLKNARLGAQLIGLGLGVSGDELRLTDLMSSGSSILNNRSERSAYFELACEYLNSIKATLTYGRPSPPRRPRALVCAPSNSGVDEILDRLGATPMVDGQGSMYTPTMCRIGSQGVRDKSRRRDANENSLSPYNIEEQVKRFISIDPELVNKVSLFVDISCCHGFLCT